MMGATEVTFKLIRLPYLQNYFVVNYLVNGLTAVKKQQYLYILIEVM